MLYRPCLENVRVSRLDQVDGQLRELRCHYGRDLYRILYQRSGNLFILPHAIEKRTGLLHKRTSTSPRRGSRTSGSG